VDSHAGHAVERAVRPEVAEAVLHVGGLMGVMDGRGVERRLGSRPGVLHVEANSPNETATVHYDPSVTTLAELDRFVEECGYHCSGRSVPGHVCNPLEEPAKPREHEAHVEHAAAAHTGHGGHAGMSMNEMVSDMRRRFFVALVFAVPIFLYSPIAVEVFGLEMPAPFGIRTDVLSLALSLPVLGYSSVVFFRGAVRALRNRTLDMMGLVATSVGVGWVYSLLVVIGLQGEHLFKAISLLAAFVLFGHWMEMRARAGASDAVRAFLDAVRAEAAGAVKALHDEGVRVVMLTGNNRATAERVASEVGIDRVLSEVRPEDKERQVAALQHDDGRVGMVGDGVSDAPPLARADVGIAIGAGTDVAVETADVVLMRSDPADVAKAMRLSRATVRKMRQNLGWAVGYNALALPLASGALAWAGLTLRPEIAAISMSGSSLLVALNALLLRRAKVD
jgi:Cu2+-exporting ATPase